MAFPEVPNWMRIVLLILSILSFIPQLHRTISRKNSSGISVYYLLFTLISTTEQFALAFFYTVDHIEEPDMFVHAPVTTGDWLNLAQTAVVALIWLILLILCLYFPSEHRDASKKVAVSAYVAFLSISLVPLLLDMIYGYPSNHLYRLWFGALYHGIHTVFLSWFITGFGVAAVFFQARETLMRSPSQALSRVGLAAQAVVFALVAVSWVMRVRFPWELLDGRQVTFGVLVTWYELVGLAAVDNAVFALGQGVLLGVVSRHKVKGEEVSEGETQPLLSD